MDTQPPAGDLKSSEIIEKRVIHAVLSGLITPGERLGEQVLCGIFGVSRTLVREAMMRLQARGIVAVSPRRGWFVVEPSVEEARCTVEARRAVETGLLLTHRVVTSEMIAALRDHAAAQRSAIEREDLAERSYLLGHFHVVLAETLGNPVLAGILEDLTTRTVLIAALYQSEDSAWRSYGNHLRLIMALEKGDTDGAVRLMDGHLTHLDQTLRARHETNRVLRLQEVLGG